MPTASSRQLTDRQRAVIERIDRRVPIKVIAQEMGVSETRINQHIRALKNIYSAESLGELVEIYRAQHVANEDDTPGADDKLAAEDVGQENLPKTHLREAVYSKTQLSDSPESTDHALGTDPGELVMSDVSSLQDQAPWLHPAEPRVVPRVLDGEHAVLLRLLAIVAIAFGFLAAVVLTVTAAVTISEALDGRAAIPVDEKGLS